MYSAIAVWHVATGSIRVWDCSALVCKSVLSVQMHSIYALTVNDGMLFSGSRDGIHKYMQHMYAAYVIISTCRIDLAMEYHDC